MTRMDLAWYVGTTCSCCGPRSKHQAVCEDLGGAVGSSSKPFETADPA
jgi:hypothetical protein